MDLWDSLPESLITCKRLQSLLTALSSACKNNEFSSAKKHFSGTHTHCLDIVIFFNLSPGNDILNKSEDIVLLKNYATADFDASQKELQFLKTLVEALEQPHPL